MGMMDSFEQQHFRRTSRGFLWFLAGHLPIFLITAYHFETGMVAATIWWAAILAGPLLAYLVAPAAKLTALSVAVASMCYSGLLIHLGRGMIEMHFHVFATLAILSAYGSIPVVLAATTAIAVHHVGFFFLLPTSVFNYQSSLGIVILHALFVVGETVPACLIADKIARFVKIQSAVTQQLGEIARGVNDSSRQLATSSETLADGAGRQAASVEETGASMEETARMTTLNAANAHTARNLAVETRSAAETGVSDMREMMIAMDAIKEASDNISKIVKSIDEIAFQTNILALNAAVEAARAGEAGAGFAVVADEVRNLAQRSALAARETSDKIADSMSKSHRGLQISAKVSGSLDQIVDKARQVEALVAEIAQASKEQSQGVEHINVAISEIGQVTQSNAANAEECASAAQELRSRSFELEALLAGLTHTFEGRRTKESSPLNPETESEMKPSLPREAAHAGFVTTQLSTSKPGGVKKHNASRMEYSTLSSRKGSPSLPDPTNWTS